MKYNTFKFVLSVCLGFIGIFLFNQPQSFHLSVAIITDIQGHLFFFIFCSLLLSILLPALRLKLLSSFQGYVVTLYQSTLIHAVGMFSAAVTPGGSGSTPALIGGLSSIRVPLGASTAISIQIFLFDLLFFAWSLPFALIYLYASTKLIPLRFFLIVFVFPAASFFVFFLMIYKSYYLRKLFFIVMRFGVIRKFRKPLVRFSREYRNSSKVFVSISFPNLLYLEILSSFYWVNLFFMFWAFMQIFHPTFFFRTLSTLLLSTFASMFAPTPGGSGFIEMFIGYGLSNEIHLASPLFLWRAATFYIFFILGPLAGWKLIKLKNEV